MTRRSVNPDRMSPREGAQVLVENYGGEALSRAHRRAHESMKESTRAWYSSCLREAIRILRAPGDGDS